MAQWMGIEVPFWLIFAIGLGLLLLVTLQVSKKGLLVSMLTLTMVLTF